jgi:chromosome segregation ATPase
MAVKLKSALEDGAAERQSTLERLADLAARTEAARLGITRDITKLEAEVKVLETDREKKRAECAKVDAEARAKLTAELRALSDEHRLTSALLDELLARLARLKDRLA